MVSLTPLISNKGVAHGVVLSLIDDHHKITIRIACTAYGVICAVPVKANDEYTSRKHLWETNLTGRCCVPGYFEAKVYKIDLLS